MNPPCSALEESVVETALGARDEVVALLAEMVACDTTAREPGDARARRREAAASARRAPGSRRRADRPVGAGTDGGRHSLHPGRPGLPGRPQLAAVLPGAGGGRSLLLNGHIDAVDALSRADWRSDPYKLDERDGALYGRGVADMKGGIARLVVALETLRRRGVRLAGDVVFCTDTDEESSGAGGHMCVRRGVRADAGICRRAHRLRCLGELPRHSDAGDLGRGAAPGTPRCRQRDWREGGAVNAIEKLVPSARGHQGAARGVARPPGPPASAAPSGRHRPHARQKAARGS